MAAVLSLKRYYHIGKTLDHMKWNAVTEIMNTPCPKEYCWVLLSVIFFLRAPRPWLSSWCMVTVISCIMGYSPPTWHSILKSPSIWTPVYEVRTGLQLIVSLTSRMMQIFFLEVPTIPSWLLNIAQDSSSLCDFYNRSTCSKILIQ